MFGNWHSRGPGLGVGQRANCAIPGSHPSPNRVSDLLLFHIQDDSGPKLCKVSRCPVTVLVKFPHCTMGLMPQERKPVETRRRSSGVFSLRLLLSPQPLLTCLHGSPRPILSNPVCLEDLNKQVMGSLCLGGSRNESGLEGRP